MGTTQACFFCQRDKPLIIFLMFLLVTGFTLLIHVAEGRFLTKGFETTKMKAVEGFKVVVVSDQTIGSRPPRCERRCDTCGHCEAIQVPITTQYQGQRRSHFFSNAFSTIAYSRGDDITNYKPMSWKCKCGNLIFNP